MLVEIKDLSQSFGHHQVLSNITFSISKGEICGLVGPNGAGKTTLLRLLTGLIPNREKKIQKSPSLKIGFLIESPALFPNLSAFDNLMYSALLFNIENPKKRVKEVLELVALQETRKKKVKHFSLGMKQRLAIGLALLDKPDLLILDEPINGLDPEGIRDIRLLLLRLREQFGMTILISSHILSELEAVADRFIIMSEGCIKTILYKEKLQSLMQKLWYLKTSQKDRTESFLKANGYTFDKQLPYFVITSSIISSTLVKLLVEEGILVEELFSKRIDLESYYMTLLEESEQ